MDPYRLKNLHRDPLPPHPRPATYRAFLYAAAAWLDEREVARAGAAAVGGVMSSLGI
jgi:hypothetical protein